MASSERDKFAIHEPEWPVKDTYLSMTEQPNIRSLLERDLRKLAVAVNLMKSRPTNSSIKDYIDNLRKTLISDTAMSARTELEILRHKVRQLQEENQNFQDNVRKLGDENKDLQDRFQKLRSENQDLRQQLETRQVEVTLPRPGTKRKRTETDILASSAEPGVAFVLDNEELSLPSAEVIDYLRNLHTLQQLLAKPKSSATDLIGVLIRLPLDVVTIFNHISTGAGQQSTDLEGNHRNTSRIRSAEAQHQRLKDNINRTQVISKTWRLLLGGMRQLIARQANKPVTDQVVIAMADCFRALIAAIVRHTEPPVGGPPDGQLPEAHHDSDPNLQWSTSATHLNMNGTHYHLCRLYLMMMASLDTEHSEHKVIMDCAMSFLLRLSGVVLEAFVFDVEQSPWRHQTAAPLWDNEHTGPLVVSKASMEAMAPYLIWVLERAIVLSRRLRRTITEFDEIPALRDPFTTAPPRKRYALSEEFKARLQSTMMHAVFPDDHRNFEDRLREPERSDIRVDIPIPVVAAADVRNWYKQEVWRILAWDVVARAT
ncbi:hypothetical protein MMC18_002324 [Xylographa bjoerkii]|nr:hypothetical protein [Xylographa bjoerkii]